MKQRGFTLIEILLVVGILGTLGSIGIASFVNFRTRHLLDVTTQELAATYRRASTAARSQENSSAWGVYVHNAASGADTFSLFYGTSYAAGTLVWSRRLDGGLEFSAPSSSSTRETVFSQITGLPAATTSITLHTRANVANSRTISINSAGEISY